MKAFVVKLLILLVLLVLVSPSMACSGPGGMMMRSIAYYMAAGYGHVSLIVAIGVLYLQIRRAGWVKTTFALGFFFVPLYLFNNGWHFDGDGDCGTSDLKASYDGMILLVGLLIWQIMASLRFLWHKRTNVQPLLFPVQL